MRRFLGGATAAVLSLVFAGLVISDSFSYAVTPCWKWGRSSWPLSWREDRKRESIHLVKLLTGEWIIDMFAPGGSRGGTGLDVFVDCAPPQAVEITLGGNSSAFADSRLETHAVK